MTPSSIQIQNLYGCYDGGYAPPSTNANEFVISSVSIPTQIYDGIVFDPLAVIGTPVCCGQEQKPAKEIWKVSYTPTGTYNWTDVHVFCSNMSEAVEICARNGISEASIKTMHRVESSKVLY